MLPTDVRCLAGLLGGSNGCEDGFALPLGGTLPRRRISSIVAACNKSSSPSLRCPTAFFKFLGRRQVGSRRSGACCGHCGPQAMPKGPLANFLVSGPIISHAGALSV